MCPAGTEKSYAPLRDTVPMLASSCGFTAEKMMIQPLRRKRELTEVFPKLGERRNGLNVSI